MIIDYNQQTVCQAWWRVVRGSCGANIVITLRSFYQECSVKPIKDLYDVNREHQACNCSIKFDKVCLGQTTASYNPADFVALLLTYFLFAYIVMNSRFSHVCLQ